MAKRKETSDLAELSAAIAKTAARDRRAKHARQVKLGRVIKVCPCQGKSCEEYAAGGRACEVGICVRMN